MDSDSYKILARIMQDSGKKNSILARTLQQKWKIYALFCSISYKIFAIFLARFLQGLNFSNYYPGRGGQTEVTPDQTSFERTHVPGALELHGLEKASSALLSGQWSGTCLIRGSFKRTLV